jgi:ketosteroid isomerase-like protein
MTAETATTVQEQIRALLNDRAAAITAREARRAVAHYAPEVVSFGLAPPLRYAGDEARDAAGIEGWFRTWAGPIGYDIGEPVIEAGDDVAFCHGLTHMTARRRTASGWTCGSGPPSGSAGRPRAGRSPTSMTPRRSIWTARAGPPPT